MRTPLGKEAVSGAGLGLRRDLLDELSPYSSEEINFLEVAPENWLNIGGYYGKRFREYTERFPFVCHGLSLSIGSPAPLDEPFVRDVKAFLDRHDIKLYSEHLSYCSDDGHLYDLMPIPFTEEAVKYVAARIRRVQEILERPLIIENVSFYADVAAGALDSSLTEIQFLNAVLSEADCQLLLDVNNVFVNSINHRYDPFDFLDQIPGDRIAYGHIAGHFDEADDLKVDTHGDAVKTEVWDLLRYSYQKFGVFPTLLERDFNFPETEELLREVQQIRQIQLSVENEKRKEGVHA